MTVQTVDLNPSNPHVSAAPIAISTMETVALIVCEAALFIFSGGFLGLITGGALMGFTGADIGMLAGAFYGFTQVSWDPMEEYSKVQDIVSHVLLRANLGMLAGLVSAVLISAWGYAASPLIVSALMVGGAVGAGLLGYRQIQDNPALYRLQQAWHRDH